MSTAIVKFSKKTGLKINGKEVEMVYCKSESYPCGLGFDLLEYFEFARDTGLFSDTKRFEIVSDIPKDIEYEYEITEDNKVKCREKWYSKDANYLTGQFRYGGTYDLGHLKKREENIRRYSIRRPEYWG